MYQRVIAVFLAICLVFGGVSFQLYRIADGDYAQVAQQNNTASVTLGWKRGTIYDCNMEPITNSGKAYKIAIKPTAEGIRALQDIADPESEEMDGVLQRLETGKPGLLSVDSSIQSTEDIKQFVVETPYEKEQIAPHIIGYWETSEQTGVTGIEKAYDTWLKQGSGTLSAGLSMDAKGRVLQGSNFEVYDNNYSSKQGVQLTLDKTIQKIAEEAMKEQIALGTVVVLEVKTGEIKAVVSCPSYHPERVAEALTQSGSPLVNRAFSPFAVGSVFKVAVCVAALEMEISPEKTIACTGSVERGSNTFRCQDQTAHGVVDMERALMVSCNGYFVTLAEEIGGEKLLETVKRLGFGEAITLAPGMISKEGNLPTAQQLQVPAALANFGFGQGDLLATPLQIAAMIATVANNGVAISPSLSKALIDEEGNVSETLQDSVPQQVVRADVCRQVQTMMIATTEAGTGKSAKPEHWGAGVKTSTAQTGKMENGKEVMHTWIGGFYPAEKPLYAIVVMNEKGSSGSRDCGPVFQEICNGLYQAGYGIG